MRAVWLCAGAALMVAACGGGGAPSGAGAGTAMSAMSAAAPQAVVVDPDVNGVAGQAYRLYRAALGRTPDPQGLGFHIHALQSGYGLADIAANFLASPEFSQRYGALDNRAFVTQLYLNVLGREPDAQGLAYHQGNLDAGRLQRVNVLTGFSESPENKTRTAAETAGGISYEPVAGAGNSETSYANYKSIGLAPMTLPMSYVDSPRAFADFTGQGRRDLFYAQLTYRMDRPQSQATPATFAFWARQADGTWLRRSDLITSGQGCIHPRKALVADFNRDGRPDVFVVCHGYDAMPFPGERNKIVLSQPGGGYVVNDASDDVGFFHGGAAADLNRDGHVDVLVINNFDPRAGAVLLNRGDGSFAREAAPRLPADMGGKNYFSAELVDVNGDARPDLIVGGHEWERAVTAVYLNPGSNDFTQASPAVIPAVANEGVVLDFTVVDTAAGRAIYVVRTSGGDGTFYQSRVVQKVLWPSLQSQVVLHERPKQWIPWLIPGTGAVTVTTDNAGDGVALTQ